MLFGVACRKAEPRATAADPYQAQRIRALTHDTDLKQKGSADLSRVRIEDR